MADELNDIIANVDKNYRKGVFYSEKSLYLTLGDSEDLKFTIFAGPDGVRVEKGKAIGNADCVLKTKPDLFIKMVKGEYMPGMMDFMRGLVKTNDPDLLMKFKEALNF